MSNPGGFSSGPFSQQDLSGLYGGYSQEPQSPSQKRPSSTRHPTAYGPSPHPQPAPYEAFYQRSPQASPQQQQPQLMHSPMHSQMHSPMHSPMQSPSSTTTKSPLVLQPGMRVLVQTSSGYVSTQLSQQSVATLLGNQIPQPPPRHARPSVIRSFPPKHTGAIAFMPAPDTPVEAPMQYAPQSQPFELLPNTDQFQFDGSLFGGSAIPSTQTPPPYMAPHHYPPAPYAPPAPAPAPSHYMGGHMPPAMAPPATTFSVPLHFSVPIPSSDSPVEMARPAEPVTPAKSVGGDSAADDKGTSPGSAGKNQYLCKYCGKRCVCASALTVHLRTHSGERPYSCTQCNRHFSRKSHLKVHQRVHSGEKPFACEICNKSFSQMSNLRAHARTHTGERPFMCEHCDKTFAVSSSLKSHQRMHTGAHVGKAHLCDKCHKCFAWAGTLLKHKKIHELENTDMEGTAFFDEEEEDAKCEAQALAEAREAEEHDEDHDDVFDEHSPVSASYAGPAGAGLAPWQRPVVRPSPRASKASDSSSSRDSRPKPLALEQQFARPTAPVNTPIDDDEDTPPRASVAAPAVAHEGLRERTRRESEGLPYDSPFPEFDMMS